jgi:hypothetical protein
MRMAQDCADLKVKAKIEKKALSPNKLKNSNLLNFYILTIMLSYEYLEVGPKHRRWFSANRPRHHLTPIIKDQNRIK